MCSPIRDYDYSWDSVEANRTGYYVGVELPPYQMDIMQYLAILSMIASIPSAPIKAELESKGKAFQDNSLIYKRGLNQNQKGGTHLGPRVLFWGCGSDTLLHAHVIEFLATRTFE